MWTTKTLPILLLAALSLKVAQSATCISYTEIAEDKIDMNYSRIDSEGKRPLGFMKGIVPFNDPDNPDGLCVKLSGVAAHQVEVAFETIPVTTLCIKDQDGKGGCREKHKDCYRVNANSDGSFSFTFTCQQNEGCSESDVTFWYRFRVSLPPDQDTEDEWCSQQDDVTYPESLAAPPPNVIPGEGITDPPVSGTRGQHVAPLTALSAVLILVVSLRTN